MAIVKKQKEKEAGSVRISDMVAKYISDMLEASNGKAEIQRNELAEALGCVPSQINYVITSRFTPRTGIYSRKPPGGRRLYQDYADSNESELCSDARHPFYWEYLGYGDREGDALEPIAKSYDSRRGGCFNVGGAF